MDFEPFSLRAEFQAEIRDFFKSRGYLEVETPYITTSSPTDPYIDPIEIRIAEKKSLFLHTSPEISMKKLLSFGYRNIFQICRVFRLDEPDELHSLEFTMLEWYADGTYLDGIREVEKLLISVLEMLELKFGIKKSYNFPIPVLDLEKLFERYLGINPYVFGEEELRNQMKIRGILNLKPEDTWIDIFLKAYVQSIEPKIKGEGPKILTGWPRDLSSMAKAYGLKAERFELLIGGIEVANGYTELLDPEEQKQRFLNENAQRRRMNKREIPIDEDFLSCLGRIKGPIYGVALGLERLVMGLLDLPSIDYLQPLRLKTL